MVVIGSAAKAVINIHDLCIINFMDLCDILSFSCQQLSEKCRGGNKFNERLTDWDAFQFF